MKALKDVNWNQVYCFFEVCRKQSMTQAARVLGVSPPTVSEQIRRLEELLGVKLFDRLPRRLELTGEGKVLFNCAREMFDVGLRFLDTVSPVTIGGYSARIGVQDTIAVQAGVDFLSRYWNVFMPFGTLNTVRASRLDQVVDGLLKGNLDWGLTMELPRSSRLVYREIQRIEMVYCCASEIWRRLGDASEVMRALPLVRNPNDVVLNELVDDQLRAAGVYPEEILEIEHRELVQRFVLQGHGVATFAVKASRDAAAGGGLRPFKIGEPIILSLYAVWLKGSERMLPIRKLNEVLTILDEERTQTTVGFS